MVIYRNSKIALLYLLVGRIFAFMNVETIRRPTNHLRYATTAYNSLLSCKSTFPNGMKSSRPLSLQARKKNEEDVSVKASSIESPPITNNKNGQAESKASQPSFARQIFCNVELNCESLEAVGFDMDFTLAQVSTLTDTSKLLLLVKLSCRPSTRSPLIC
jgi:hypothetical protein